MTTPRKALKDLNLGTEGTIALAHWANDNPADFYELFLATCGKQTTVEVLARASWRVPTSNDIERAAEEYRERERTKAWQTLCNTHGGKPGKAG